MRTAAQVTEELAVPRLSTDHQSIESEGGVLESRKGSRSVFGIDPAT